MNFNPWLATPEIFLLCAAICILLTDLFVNKKPCVSYVLSLLTLGITASLLISGATSTPELAFYGLFVSDPIATLSKLGMVLGLALAFIYGRTYTQIRGLFRSELFVLCLLALLGMMVMASGQHLVTLYMGLELLSLSLYALIGLQRESVRAMEAAIKYFVLGALASGFLLYGMSMIYGATASLDLGMIAERIAHHEANMLLALFGLVFILTGLCFKLGVAPFHMWVPDVYEGAPTFLSQLIASAPKLAVFLVIFRLLGEALSGFIPEWRSMLEIVAVLSLVIGNVTAIVQTNIKRMFAYSTISHMAYLILGILVGDRFGFSAAFFYVLSYILMSTAGFGMILLLSREGVEADQIQDFKGLSQRNPWFAGMMLIVMLSMAGVPVSLGFFAKFAIIQALISMGMIGLAVLVIIFSLIGAFYYLRIIKLMYFDSPQTDAPIVCPLDFRWTLSINCLLLIVLGFAPDQLLMLVSDAVQQSLSAI